MDRIRLKNTYIIDDTLKEIMLNADYNTIKTYCQSNKNALKLCKDENFWIMKFNHDNLPIMTDATMKEYLIIYKIKNYITHLTNLLTSSYDLDKYNAVILKIYNSVNDIFDYTPYLPDIEVDITINQKIVIQYDRKYTISINDSDNMDMTEDEIAYLLFNIIYYLPEVHIKYDSQI